MKYYINKIKVDIDEVCDVKQRTTFIKMKEILEDYGANAIKVINLYGSDLTIENFGE